MSFLSWFSSNNNIIDEDSATLEKAENMEESPLKAETEEQSSDVEQSVTESNVSHMEQSETPVFLHGENIYEMSFNTIRSHLKEMGINAGGKKHIVLKKLLAVVESGDAERLEYRHKLRTPEKAKSSTKARRSTRSRRSTVTERSTPAASTPPTKSRRQRKSQAAPTDHSTPMDTRREEENETPYFSSEEMEEEATLVKAKPSSTTTSHTIHKITPLSNLDEPVSPAPQPVAHSMDHIETISTAATCDTSSPLCDFVEEIQEPRQVSMNITNSTASEHEVFVLDDASSVTSSVMANNSAAAVVTATVSEPSGKDAIGILGDRFLSVIRGDGPKLSEDEYAFFRRLLENGRPASAPIALQPVSPRASQQTLPPAPPTSNSLQRVMPPPSVAPTPPAPRESAPVASAATKKRDASGLDG